MYKTFLILTTFFTALSVYSVEYTYRAGTSVAMSWNVNDKIGVFPVNYLQSRFDVVAVDANDMGVSQIDGHGKSLNNNARYFALSPYNYDYYLNDNLSTALPLTYPVLTQTTNGDIQHIAEADFMVASVMTTATDEATFKFEHLGALLRMNVMVPKTATFNKLTISTSKSTFLVDGTLNIETGAITPATTAATVELRLNDISVERGNLLTTYSILPATDLSGNTVTVTLQTTAGEEYSCTFDGMEMKAGRLYNIERTLHMTGKTNVASFATRQQSFSLPERDTAPLATGPVKRPTCVASDFIIDLNDVDFEPLPPEYVLGDVNEDGTINVGDITAVANHILGHTPMKFNRLAADANEDGNINVGDITKIAKTILTGNK